MARGRSKSETETEVDDAPAPERRIDKWLYFTRTVKTRSLAAELATTGKIRVNGIKIAKSSACVKIGDVVTFVAHTRVRVLKVLATGVRRGPAPEAQGLYEDLSPPPPPRQPDPGGHRDPGAGRPTKRDRRLIVRMKG